MRLHIISLLKVLFLESSFRSSGVARVVFIFEFNLCGVVCCGVSYVVMMFFFFFYIEFVCILAMKRSEIILVRLHHLDIPV